MFDNIHETDTWQDTLRRGDIVLFRFPEVDSINSLPKIRPCLVLEVDSGDGDQKVTLAYGTTARTAANRGYEIWVKRRSSLAIAGLDHQTRFVGARTVFVSLDHADFDQGPRGTPVIGHLDAYLIKRMHAVRARLRLHWMH